MGSEGNNSKKSLYHYINNTEAPLPDGQGEWSTLQARWQSEQGRGCESMPGDGSSTNTASMEKNTLIVTCSLENNPRKHDGEQAGERLEKVPALHVCGGNTTVINCNDWHV